MQTIHEIASLQHCHQKILIGCLSWYLKLNLIICKTEISSRSSVDVTWDVWW